MLSEEYFPFKKSQRNARDLMRMENLGTDQINFSQTRCASTSFANQKPQPLPSTLSFTDISNIYQ